MHQNSGQQLAIDTVEGQLLVIAGPGSGKTTTMLARIHHMVADCGIQPKNILMVTFTKAAALEMESRYKEKYNGTDVTFSTIHSLCWRILQDYCAYRPDQVFSEQDQYEYFRSFLKKDRTIEDKETFITNLINDISMFRNNSVDLKHYEPKCTTEKEKFADIYRAYKAHKQDIHRIDYDDMQILAYNYIRQNQEALKELRNRFRYIMVDEYQDTNIVQRNLIYLIAWRDGNLAVVGDDDQSIYAFRGARPQIMLDFTKDYPNAVTARLDVNYRSLSEVIRKSQALIRCNENRFQKELRGFREGRGSARYHEYSTKESEIDALGNLIEEDLKNGLKPEDIAVLYRINQQSERVANELMNRDIPFCSNEPIKSRYDHWIYRDILTYHRLAIGQGDFGDMFSIINHPNRYLTKECAACEMDKDAMIRTATRMKKEDWQVQSAIDTVQDLFYLFCKMKSTPSEGIEAMNKFKYPQYFKEYGYEDENTLQAIWDEFRVESGRFSKYEEWDLYAKDFTAKMREAAKKKEGIRISTMHKSKGLEWKKVYIIDAIQGICPYQKAETKDDIEEERRLFYVAMTRAKDDLVIMSYRSGVSGDVESTQFWEEIREQLNVS